MNIHCGIVDVPRRQDGKRETTREKGGAAKQQLIKRIFATRERGHVIIGIHFAIHFGIECQHPRFWPQSPLNSMEMKFYCRTRASLVRMVFLRQWPDLILVVIQVLVGYSMIRISLTDIMTWLVLIGPEWGRHYK